MSKKIHPMSTSVQGEVYFKMPHNKYFNDDGALPGSAEAIKNEDEETRRNYNKLLRVGKLHDIEIRRGGFGSIANYGLVLYLEQHPEKTLTEALDPEIDVEEKRAYGTRALNIMSGLPEYATPEEADRYIENNEYVKDEEYVANVSGLIQKGVKMFINIDYGKELLYAYEAQGKDIHEVLNDPANLQNVAFFIQNLTTFQQAIYQTFRESGKVRTTACYDDLNIFKKLDTQFKDVNTINIYKDAYTKLDAEGLRSDFIKAQGYNYSFLSSSMHYAALCMGNRVAHDPEFEESVSRHTKLSGNYIEGKITGLKQLGTLKPEEFRPNNIADVEKSDDELNRSAAVFWEALRNIADYHKFTEIPDDVWGYTVDENNQVKYKGKAHNVQWIADEALSDIMRQELADTFFYNAAMARHTLYKDSEELLMNAYTPEQRAEIAEIVKNDKNLEAFANSKELAAFTLAHAMAGGNANNIFTEKSLMDFDGKSAVDFLKANTMFTVKADGTFDVYNVRDEAAVRNIKQLADSAYNSLCDYTFPAAGADLSGSAYYGFAELARFAENCSAAFKNVDSRLANPDDPALKTAAQFAHIMSDYTKATDPYKTLAAKLVLDRVGKEMQGKSMAQIGASYPKDFLKNFADGVAAKLHEQISDLNMQEVKDFVATNKYTDRIKSTIHTDVTAGALKEHDIKTADCIAENFVRLNKFPETPATQAFQENMQFYMRQILQGDEYRDRCAITGQEKMAKERYDFQSYYLPLNVTNEMLKQATDLALQSMRDSGIDFDMSPATKGQPNHIDAAWLASPFAAHENYTPVEDKYKKDIANINIKKPTAEALVAGMAYYDAVMREHPQLKSCLDQQAVGNVIKSTTDLFVIDGKPADEYVKSTVGKKYFEYSRAEQECLLKTAIAGAITDGKHVVEAKQYFIEEDPDDPHKDNSVCQTCYTRITSDMNADKSRKLAEKYDKSAEKKHEELKKTDPVVAECQRLSITKKQDRLYKQHQEIKQLDNRLANKGETLEFPEANVIAHKPQNIDFRRKDAGLSSALKEATSTHSDKKVEDIHTDAPAPEHKKDGPDRK